MYMLLKLSKYMYVYDMYFDAVLCKITAMYACAYTDTKNLVVAVPSKQSCKHRRDTIAVCVTQSVSGVSSHQNTHAHQFTETRRIYLEMIWENLRRARSLVWIFFVLLPP